MIPLKVPSVVIWNNLTPEKSMSPQACLMWSNIVKIEFFPFLWSREGGAFRDVNLADNMTDGTDLLGARK